MKTSRKERPRDCLCYDEYIRDGRDFQTIIDLKDSGLVIYHHEDRTGNVSDRPGGSKANKQKEVPESGDKPNNDVFIVHNTRGEEIKPADLVQNLETNKITCRRCKTIYEHAQKLLQKVPILNKNNVMGICTHCYLKAQPVGACRKCADIVKKFVATKGETFEDNKMRLNTWLTKINRLLDDIVTDEVPRNLKSRANLEVYINDLRETPSQTTCDRSEVRRILKSKIPKNFQSHAQSEINFHDLLDTPSRTTYDRSEVKRPFKSQMHLSDTDITASVSNIWNDMKSDVPSKSLKVKKEKPLEIGSVSNIWNEMKSNIPEKNLRAKKERPQEVGSVSNIWNEMKSDLPEQPLKTKKERPLEVKREQSLDVKKEKRLQVKKDKSLVAKSSNWKVAKYSIRYMQDKYDIRHFDENPTQRKKYCVAKLHGKSSHFKISHQQSVSDHHRLDKKIHFSKQTIDDSKHKAILKPSKLPKKFQSDETMIATISKATKKSSQKDLVYFFPKDIKKKELQPKSYVSSSTLIVETREKFKGENKTLKYEDDKNKFDGDNMFGRGNKIGLAAGTNKKVNSLASTVTTKTKTDRDSRKGQDDKLRKTDRMMRDSDKQKIMKDGDKQQMMKGSDTQKIMKDSDKQKIMNDSDKQNIMKDSDKQKMPSDKTNEVITPSKELSNNPSKEINKDEDDLAKYDEAKRLRELRALQKEQELKAKADQKAKGKTDGTGAKEVKDPRKIELDMNQIKTHISSGGLIIKTTNDVKKDIGPIPTIGSDVMLALNLHNRSIDDPYLSSNTELIGEDDSSELILGEKIFQHKPLMWDKISDAKNLPLLYQTLFEEESATDAVPVSADIEPQETIATRPPTESKGIIRYALSDRAFIEKGWTKLPTEKIVRRMNVYRMRPAHPELNWFENNKNKQPVQYDTGETLATFDENGRGRWYYKNGRLALDYYDAEEANAQQRFVVYSSGEPDEHGRKYPITVLAAFDYLGNGVVFDHTGKIRLNYNQTEGVVLDRGVGPVSHWKWHALNDPPVLQQVMIDTDTHNKDPEILKLGLPTDNLPRTDNEEMLAIEFENFVKEKQKKLAQEYKPFQIKMKALRINENFSLRVLDQATVYLIFRDGLTTFKLNLGMLLDHHEIVDTDTADLGEVKNNVERLPTRTDSLEGLRRSVVYAQRHERARTERDRKLRIPEPSSADRLIAGASRPLRCPFRTISEKCYCSRKPSTNNMYYDTRII